MSVTADDERRAEAVATRRRMAWWMIAVIVIIAGFSIALAYLPGAAVDHVIWSGGEWAGGHWETPRWAVVVIQAFVVAVSPGLLPYTFMIEQRGTGHKLTCNYRLKKIKKGDIQIHYFSRGRKVMVGAPRVFSWMNLMFISGKYTLYENDGETLVQGPAYELQEYKAVMYELAEAQEQIMRLKMELYRRDRRGSEGSSTGRAKTEAEPNAE